MNSFLQGRLGHTWSDNGTTNTTAAIKPNIFTKHQLKIRATSTTNAIEKVDGCKKYALPTDKIISEIYYEN